ARRLRRHAGPAQEVAPPPRASLNEGRLGVAAHVPEGLFARGVTPRSGRSPARPFGRIGCRDRAPGVCRGASDVGTFPLLLSLLDLELSWFVFERFSGVSSCPQSRPCWRPAAAVAAGTCPVAGKARCACR